MSKLQTTPGPGSRPVKVSREIPVTVIAHADGTQTVVQTDTAEPCYGCECCVLWTQTVETLRAAIVAHERAESAPVGVVAPDPDCLVCQLLLGVADG